MLLTSPRQPIRTISLPLYQYHLHHRIMSLLRSPRRHTFRMANPSVQAWASLLCSSLAFIGGIATSSTRNSTTFKHIRLIKDITTKPRLQHPQPKNCPPLISTHLIVLFLRHHSAVMLHGLQLRAIITNIHLLYQLLRTMSITLRPQAQLRKIHQARADIDIQAVIIPNYARKAISGRLIVFSYGLLPTDSQMTGKKRSGY